MNWEKKCVFYRKQEGKKRKQSFVGSVKNKKREECLRKSEKQKRVLHKERKKVKRVLYKVGNGKRRVL